MTSTSIIDCKIEIARDIYSLGITLLNLGKVNEAAFQFKKALGIYQDYTDASLALGHCFHLLRKHDKALVIYDRLLSAFPLLVEAWNNRGNTLIESGRFGEAAESFSRALELSPGMHDTRVALATCMQALGRDDEALDACESVLASNPCHAEARWNRSLLLLLQGNYREGWRDYEWRWKKRNFSSPLRNFPCPRWQGEEIDGKSLLIHAEQGFGDTIQFCRYIPIVASMGASVTFECQPPLAALMKTLSEDVNVVAMGTPLPSSDYHIPLMSLPNMFGTVLETIPRDTPYLRSLVCETHFNGNMEKEPGSLKAGLCWAGKSYPDPRRSCPAELLSPLGGIDNISWYSLQLDRKEELPFPIIDLTADIRGFHDTAALVSCLDLVITIDTSVAHLAGALGKPTWVMLPHAPDWRWMKNRDDSPWYPSMRLFRQLTPGSWQETVRRIGNSLRQKALERNP